MWFIVLIAALGYLFLAEVPQDLVDEAREDCEPWRFFVFMALIVIFAPALATAVIVGGWLCNVLGVNVDEE